jgi:hypothetical protein
MSIYQGSRANDAIALFRAQAAAVPALAFTKSLSDDMVLSFLRSGEKTVQMRLGVLLEPTLILCEDLLPAHLPQTTPREPLRFSEELVIPGPKVGILAAKGSPYLTEAGYDYEASRYQHDEWGWIELRQPQVIEVLDMRFAYSQSPPQREADKGNRLPLEWLRLVKKNGHLRIVPNSAASFIFGGGNGSLAATAFRSSARIPHAWRISYRAGIEDIFNTWPNLVMFIGRVAMAEALKGAFPAQSGSISADGLSQSASFDLNAFLGGGAGGGGMEAEFSAWRRELVGIQMVFA